MQRLRRVVGRNRMVMLNIFKYVAHRRSALMIIGQLCKKYHTFAKSDMSLFEMFEKEKKQNYVCSEQELFEFMKEVEKGTKDFNLELFLRVKYLPKFMKECGHIRVRDLCVIFDNI